MIRQLETVDAADPDAPNRTIRRARVVDPILAIRLTGHELATVERIRRDSDLATGYREDDSPLGERVDTFTRGGDGYSADMLDALRVMAWMSSGIVMSRQQWDVVHNVVVMWYSIKQSATWLRIDRETATRRLRSGLAAAGAWYDGPGGTRR